MPVIRRGAQGTAWFAEDSANRVLALIRNQCSATRSAYQAIQKHGLRGNDIKKHVKVDYMPLQNQRYVSDACSLASGISQENAIFGGKRLWKEMASGKLPKEQWQAIRNRQLYSRGDRTKAGNPNIRVVNDRLLVNDPLERGRWIEGSMFLPKKFKPDWACYDIRLVHEAAGRFKVSITWEENAPEVQATVPGAVGVDSNPDGVAVSEVDGNGNLVSQHYDLEQRIQFASKGKRDHDVRMLAKRVVGEAKETGKPLVIERLCFGKKKDGHKGKKFRRMKSNFLYKQVASAIRSRAIREGIPLVEVNPAFTSVLGALKYQKMLGLSVHNAAAMVIARRGMGLLERQDFGISVAETKKVRARKPRRNRKGKKGRKTDWSWNKVDQLSLNLEGRGEDRRLTVKAWTWLRDRFLKPKKASLTGTPLAAGACRSAIGGSGDQTPGEPRPTTGRPGRSQNRSGEEKAPLDAW